MIPLGLGADTWVLKKNTRVPGNLYPLAEISAYIAANLFA